MSMANWQRASAADGYLDLLSQQKDAILRNEVSFTEMLDSDDAEYILAEIIALRANPELEPSQKWMAIGDLLESAIDREIERRMDRHDPEDDLPERD
jgi:hypothetical protein